MPSDSPALTSAPNRYWPDDRSQCSRYEGTPARSSLMTSVATPATADAQRRPVGRHVVVQVDPAQPGQQVRRVRAGDPHQRPAVGQVDHADEFLGCRIGRHRAQPAGRRRGRAGRGEHEPLARARADDQPAPPSGLAPSRSARPNGTPSALAIAPFHGARRWTLASAVQSVMVSAASLRPPLTSQPASTRTGRSRGDRAPGQQAQTRIRAPFGIHVSEVLGHPGADQPAVRAAGP